MNENKRQRAINAEHWAAVWLSRANEAKEKGNKIQEEKFLSKAQIWLDRANVLRGWD